MKRGISTIVIVIYAFAMLVLAVVALGSTTALFDASQDAVWTGRFTPTGTLVISLAAIVVLTWRLVVHARARVGPIPSDTAKSGEVQ